MVDNLETYFHHRVKAVYERYLVERQSSKMGKRRDLMAATDAAKALCHLREHIPSPYSKDRSAVARVCPDYALVCDVADADKHCRLNNQTRTVSNASQIEERIIVTEYQDEHGTYRHAEKRVLLNLTGSDERDLLDVLTNVINYWLDELHTLGHLGKLPHYKMPVHPQPVPREEANDSRIDFELIQGLAYTQSFQYLRYNYDSGKIEPINLTGADLRFIVYKPQYTLDINATNDATGQIVSRSVTITEEEFRRLQALATKEEKGGYLFTLPQVQASYCEITQEISSLSTASVIPAS